MQNKITVKEQKEYGHYSHWKGMVLKLIGQEVCSFYHIHCDQYRVFKSCDMDVILWHGQDSKREGLVKIHKTLACQIQNRGVSQYM